MAKKAIETRDTLADEEKTVAQMASEAMDAEEEQGEKKKRIRRGKKQIIIDKVKAYYLRFTEKSVFEKELAKISASLEAMENAKLKKHRISEGALFDMFTLEELESMIQKRKAEEN